jgi:hypothetical protein
MWLMGVLAGSTTAQAQERGRVGVAAGYPASVDVIWNVSNRVALRPDITWSQSSGDTTTSVTLNAGVASAVSTSRTSNDTWNVSVGLSALFYFHEWDALRAYVSPRVAYTRGTIHSSTTTILPIVIAVFPPPPPTAVTNTASTTMSGYLTSGSFGAEYSFGRRFAIFGEIGLAYTDSTTTTRPDFSASSRGFGTRSGVGAMFYF